jgi:hypothetical protein
VIGGIPYYFARKGAIVVYETCENYFNRLCANFVSTMLGHHKSVPKYKDQAKEQY